MMGTAVVSTVLPVAVLVHHGIVFFIGAYDYTRMPYPGLLRLAVERWALPPRRQEAFH